MSLRTLRGSIIEGDIKRLVVDDGRYTQGYKVVEFYVWCNPNASTKDAYGSLALNSNFGAALQDASENSQIAWAGNSVAGTGGQEPPFSIIDPNHVVVRDLYLRTEVGSSGGTQAVNYMVVLEQITLTPDQGVLQLIKERSQDELR